MIREKKDEDELSGTSLFAHLEKSQVLQETRIFNDTPINVKKCCLLITKILYLLGQGEGFTKNEATEVFFAVTKLFQNKDVALRRMMYLVLKELKPSDQEVIIVTSSLTKDMNSNKDLYRAHATRVLCKITDHTMLNAIERHLKQAIVDKSPLVSSATLAAGIHLLKSNADVVKRWVSEVQEAVNSKSKMVQFHALALLHEIKANDKLALCKVVTSLTKNPPRGPLAQCLLIRYALEVLEEDSSSSAVSHTLLEFLDSCLRNKSEMVMFEAARALCFYKNVQPRELTAAVNCLDTFLLGSSKTVYRFAAVKCLNMVASIYPLAVTTCNVDLECLITDSNRTVATLAITTLLKTGSETSVDRLLKQINPFMADINDEFKVIVVDAIRSLCTKFVGKNRLLMGFLANLLREEGGFEFKKAIVETFLHLIATIPDARESGFAHLCEFIEDCEFTHLSTLILHVLGQEGPKTSDPAKYIRFIYNRVILENATVRASAVSALAKFGMSCPKLLDSILILLKRTRSDNDDEVRERASIAVAALEQQKPVYVQHAPPCSFLAIEAQLKEYLAVGDTASAFPFQEARTDAEKTHASKELAAAAKSLSSAKTPSTAVAAETGGQGLAGQGAVTANPYGDLIKSIPSFATIDLGNLFKSSKPVELTEAETEYTVSCVKHVFPNHVLFQFNCTNTIEEQVLENVTVKMEIQDVEGLEPLLSVAAEKLEFGVQGVAFVLYEREADEFPSGTFSNLLRFTVKEIDPSTGEAEEDGMQDDYQVDDVELHTSDYMNRVMIADFKSAWDHMGPLNQTPVAFRLDATKVLSEAVHLVIDQLGMQACGGTEKIKSGTRSHVIHLSGCFLGDHKVLAEASVAQDGSDNILLKLVVRCADAEVAKLVPSSVG